MTAWDAPPEDVAAIRAWFDRGVTFHFFSRIASLMWAVRAITFFTSTYASCDTTPKNTNQRAWRLTDGCAQRHAV
jgi:hypothetical protein